MLRKISCVIGVVAILVSLSVGVASAQDNNPNQRTYFTFSHPVELPGKTLPAGTYLFRLVDSPSNRHVVQVFDEKERQIHATVLAIPAERMKPSDEPEVRFMEVAANQPAAIRTWWYPGRTIGHEFIYPKDQAMRLAGRINEPVLSVATDATGDAMRDAELARINASGQTTAVESTTAAAEVPGTAFPGSVTAETQVATTTPAPTTTAQTETTTAAATTTPAAVDIDTTRTELPRTASFLPLVAVIGLGSLAGALSLRRRRQ